VLLKEVTLEDLRQAARTGGLPATPERMQAARGHPGIPAALSGVEPFVRTADGRSTGTAGQPMAERMMAAQRSRVNEFGQPHEEGYDPVAFANLPKFMRGNSENYGTVDIDEARHGNNPMLPGFDDSMSDPIPVEEDLLFDELSRPPEGRNPAQMQQTPEQMQQLGQSLSEHGISPNLRFPEGVEQDYDLRDEQETSQANRAKTLASQSAQSSTPSPMDAAMQALGNRKTEEAARVPKPVQPTRLNEQGRNKGRGRGRNSQRNRNRRR